MNRRRQIAASIVFAALAIPVAVSSAGTPSTVKVPLEHNNTCNNFTGKKSPTGYLKVTRLKNGDMRMTVVDRGVPGTHVTVYPWSDSPDSCDYYYNTEGYFGQ